MFGSGVNTFYVLVRSVTFHELSHQFYQQNDHASGGNVWNIVIQPLGSIVLGSTLLACLLHVFVGVWLDRVTRRQLQLVGPGLEGSWDSPIPDGSGCTALAKQAPRPPQIVVRYDDQP